MNALCRNIAFRERIGETIGSCLRARERESAKNRIVFEQLDEQIGLAILLDSIDRLRHTVSRLLRWRKVDAHRIDEHLLRELENLGWNGRREKQRLALSR